MHEIELKKLDKSFTLTKPENIEGVDINSTAIKVFTDFRKTSPRMLESSTSLETARNLMIKEHVKLKVVIGENEEILGAVSYDDLNGEKSIIAVKELGSRDDVQVSDVMTPIEDLKALPFNELCNSSVKDVLYALQKEHVQHFFVMGKKEEQNSIVGILSASDIARKLSLPISIDKGPTFKMIFELT